MLAQDSAMDITEVDPNKVTYEQLSSQNLLNNEEAHKKAAEELQEGGYEHFFASQSENDSDVDWYDSDAVE